VPCRVPYGMMGKRGLAGAGRMLDAPVLVLNQNYEPLHICTVRRALVLLDKGKAEILVDGRGFLHTPSATVPVPSVIRLHYLVRRPFVQRRLSRREVFLRDHYTCQYCGRQAKVLTLDHVIPRHRGGANTWENVVTACIPCNHKKAGRTPQEAGMRLLRRPRPPYAHPYVLFFHRPLQEEWKPYLPWLT
jgi:5-methylcytosine-specific restriction endonuclease McrA